MSIIFIWIHWRAVLKTSYFLNTKMHEVKAKDLGSCLSRTWSFYSVTLQCRTWKHMIIVKTCEVKKFFNKFLEISRKIRINFWKFRTHNTSATPLASAFYSNLNFSSSQWFIWTYITNQYWVNSFSFCHLPFYFVVFTCVLGDSIKLLVCSDSFEGMLNS